MPGSSLPRVLIVYSNPIDSTRLRLDIENRMLDAVIQRRKFPANRVRRLHAATISDFSMALREHDYDIVQFSGHGSEEGIYLEQGDFSSGVLVDAGRVAKLLKESHPHLHAAIFVSCFSAAQLNELAEAAAFVITLNGPAHDDAAIEFVSTFYDCYFQFHAIEPAFRQALIATEAAKTSAELVPVLSRRAKEREGDRIRICAFVGNRADSVVIDVTDAQRDIENLDIEVESFYYLLSNKIRLHRWIFAYPRERTTLSIGKYIGEFSWQERGEIVFCKRVWRIRQDAPDAIYILWGGLLVDYNDLSCERYRSLPEPAAPQNERLLRSSIDAFQRTANLYFRGGKASETLREILPEQYRATIALLEPHLLRADASLTDDDFGKAVSSLEIALSSIHNLVEAFTNLLREDSQCLWGAANPSLERTATPPLSS